MRVRRYNARNCGIFFFAGVATSLLLDLLGATPLSTVSLFGFGMNFLSFWFVPIVFAIVGVFIGIFSKHMGIDLFRLLWTASNVAFYNCLLFYCTRGNTF